MSITATQRRVVVLLPRCTPADTDDRLLDAACGLANTSGQTLDVIELCSPDTAPTPLAMASASTWWHATHPALSQPISDSLVKAGLQALAASGLLAGSMPLLVLIPPGPQGCEVAARLATHLGASALGGCSSISLVGERVIAQRAGWGGRVEMTLHSDERVCVATLRSAGIAQDTPIAREQPCLRTLALDGSAPPAFEITPVAHTDALPPLEGASIVVSGGRGMQGKEGFDLLRTIAELLGASLGGSLPTVDAGWVPVSRQIGQSGKFVSPRLYLAVGISGTPQHLAGIGPDTPIVALNKDPGAPIFKVAQAGVVGDWQEMLPLLVRELKAAR